MASGSITSSSTFCRVASPKFGCPQAWRLLQPKFSIVKFFCSQLRRGWWRLGKLQTLPEARQHHHFQAWLPLLAIARSRSSPRRTDFAGSESDKGKYEERVPSKVPPCPRQNTENNGSDSGRFPDYPHGTWTLWVGGVPPKTATSGTHCIGQDSDAHDQRHLLEASPHLVYPWLTHTTPRDFELAICPKATAEHTWNSKSTHFHIQHE